MHLDPPDGSIPRQNLCYFMTDLAKALAAFGQHQFAVRFAVYVMELLAYFKADREKHGKPPDSFPALSPVENVRSIIEWSANSANPDAKTPQAVSNISQAIRLLESEDDRITSCLKAIKSGFSARPEFIAFVHGLIPYYRPPPDGPARAKFDTLYQRIPIRDGAPTAPPPQEESDDEQSLASDEELREVARKPPPPPPPKPAPQPPGAGPGLNRVVFNPRQPQPGGPRPDAGGDTELEPSPPPPPPGKFGFSFKFTSKLQKSRAFQNDDDPPPAEDKPQDDAGVPLWGGRAGAVEGDWARGVAGGASEGPLLPRGGTPPGGAFCAPQGKGTWL